MPLVEPTSGRASLASTQASTQVRQLLLIDDDDLSREVLGLIAAEAEFATISFASGEDALAHLSAAESPFAILADMQMPGVHGNELAQRLRAACGPQSVLLAMSGSPVPDEQTAGFDGFLLKPFSSQDLLAACERTPRSLAREESKNDNAILDHAVYAKFARSLPPAQLAGLYAMCLSDARKRIETMRRALAERDDDLYRRSAHAIKGGCGMVGAIELTRLAAAMEREGMAAIVEGVTDEASLTEFLAASFRLERMLDRK